MLTEKQILNCGMFLNPKSLDGPLVAGDDITPFSGVKAAAETLITYLPIGDSTSPATRISTTLEKGYNPVTGKDIVTAATGSDILLISAIGPRT